MSLSSSPSQVTCTNRIPTQRKAAEKAEKAPRAKSKKDPKAPKRALSAYMFFSQDWRERIKTENPDAGFGKSPLPSPKLGNCFFFKSFLPCAFAGEVGKLLGAKWKELDDEEKKVCLEPLFRKVT